MPRPIAASHLSFVLDKVHNPTVVILRPAQEVYGVNAVAQIKEDDLRVAEVEILRSPVCCRRPVVPMC